MNIPPGLGALAPQTETGIVPRVGQHPSQNAPEHVAHNPNPHPAPHPAAQPAPPQPALAQMHLQSLAARFLEWHLASMPRSAGARESNGSAPPQPPQSDLRSPARGGLDPTARAEPSTSPRPNELEVHSDYQPMSPQPLNRVPRAALEGYLSANRVLPSHLLAHQGNSRLLTETLLQAPAELNAQDAAGNTPLLAACRAGQTDAAIALLVFGANPNIADKSGCTPLHLAVEHPQPELARALLTLGAQVDAASMTGNTPLHRAAFKGHIDHITELLHRGATVNRPNIHGVNPLHAAAGQDHLDAVKLLSIHGANPLAQMRLPSGQMAKPSEVCRTPEVRDYLSNLEQEMSKLLDLIQTSMRA